jgi:chemotaxis response regulator CheB
VNASEQQSGRSRLRLNSAFDVVALAACPTWPKALNYILAGPPADFFTSVFVVKRLCACPDQPSLLADVLSRRGALVVKHTVDRDVLRPASVITPDPDRPPVVRLNGTVSLAPQVQFVRRLHDIALAPRTLEGALGGW